MDVNVAITLTNTNYPAGSNAGAKLDCRLLQGAATAAQKQLAAPFPASVTFPAVPAGAYTLSMQVLDTYGGVIGSAYTAPVTVPAPPPVVQTIPTGATVTFA